MRATKRLYIPIWFYSNLNCEKFAAREWILYIPIWFYSNLSFLSTSLYLSYTLHSNLVLFKYYDNTVNLPYISTFTFQSGSIQISNHSFCNLFYRLLYIPIWFYSNYKSTVYTCFIPFFTFQSGSIQIIQGVGSYVAEIFPLHSNLVLFKFMRQPYTSA